MVILTCQQEATTRRGAVIQDEETVLHFKVMNNPFKDFDRSKTLAAVWGISSEKKLVSCVTTEVWFMSLRNLVGRGAHPPVAFVIWWTPTCSWLILFTIT